MLRMYGFDGGAPVHRAHGALRKAAPEIRRIGGESLDLTVLPHWTEYRAPRPARADAWYDLLWTAPADRLLLDHAAYLRRTDAEHRHLAAVLTRAGELTGPGRDGEDESLDQAVSARGRMAELLRKRALAAAGHVPMPRVIPAQTRLAGAAPVTLDGMDEGHIAFCGGPERTLEMLRRRQRIAMEGDRSVDSYDWDAWGHHAAAVIGGLTMPKER
jgi:hypothetical protein